MLARRPVALARCIITCFGLIVALLRVGQDVLVPLLAACPEGISSIRSGFMDFHETLAFV
jgi:hypothetical protein